MSTQIIIAFVFGIAFVVCLLALAIVFPTPTPFQYNVFRIVLALAAAGVGAMLPGFMDLRMDLTIPGLLLRSGGALAVFVVVFFFNPAKLAAPSFETSAGGEGADPEETPPEDGKLHTKLFVVLGDGHLGPIDMTLYTHHKPEMLTSQVMNDPLRIPLSMRTESPRRIYWKEGRTFLDESIEYWTQGVRPNSTLILTDQEDRDMVETIADTLTSLAEREA